MAGQEETYKEYDAMVERHRRFILVMCQRASYGREWLCRELLQECYVELLKRMPELAPTRGGREELRWVYGRCRVAITRYRRRVARWSELPLTAVLAESVAGGGEVNRLTVDELASCLDGAERRMFMMLSEGADDGEIARVLGLKRRTVVQMRHNIKKKLIKYIES